MTKKTLLILLALILFINPKTLANPRISSGSAILMETETGQILFDKDSDKKQFPASITKVLTALVVLERNNLTDSVVVGSDVPYLIEPGSSAIYLLPGEKLTVEQLMYGLMVESANDAAVTLAQRTGGSIPGFAKLMNEKAKELGATNSNFVNPNGLHSDNHYTTAHDMALIMREAIKNPTLLKLMKTSNYVIPATNKQQTRYLWTKNRLFKSDTDEFFYDKVIASKTGYTSMAKNTLVSAAEKNGMKLISVVLQSNGPEVFHDTISMFDYGFDHYEPSTLVSKNQLIKKQEINNATSPLTIVSRSTVKYIKNKDETKEIQPNIKISNNLSSSIKQGDKIGTVEYIVGNHTIGKAELVAGNEVKSKSAIYNNKISKSSIWAVAGVILLYLIIRILVYLKNVKIRKRNYSRRYGLTYGKSIYKPKSRRNQYSRY